MTHHRSRLIASSLLLFGTQASACVFPPTSPDEQYSTHSQVVLAHPIAIATEPKQALSEEFSGAFTQTIQWRVLISWKGSYKIGDVFTTIEAMNTSNCGSGAQHTREAMLLYLVGQEPYRHPEKARPTDRLEDLKYLDRIKRRGG